MHFTTTINFIVLLLLSSAAAQHQAQMYEKLPTLIYNNNTADHLIENNTNLYHSLETISATTTTAGAATTTTTTPNTNLSKENDGTIAYDNMNSALHIDLNENNIFSTDSELSADLDDEKATKSMQPANIGKLVTLSTLTTAPELVPDTSLLSNTDDSHTGYNNKENKASNTESEELPAHLTTEHPILSNGVMDSASNSSAQQNDDPISQAMQNDKPAEKYNTSQVQMLNPAMMTAPDLATPAYAMNPSNISLFYLGSEMMQALQQHMPSQPQPQAQSQQMLDDIAIDEAVETLLQPGPEGPATSTTTANSQLSSVTIARAGIPAFLAPFSLHWTTTAPNFLTSTSKANTATSASTINKNTTESAYNNSMQGTFTISTTDATTTQTPNANEKKSKQIMMNKDRLQAMPNRLTTTTTPESKDKFNGHHNIYKGADDDDSASQQQKLLLPHEKLRSYIDDAYIRMPLAIIVDPSNRSLEKTKLLWNRAFNANVQIQIFLVALNKSGTPFVFHCDNSTQFLNRLNSIKEHNDGNVFNGILYTTNLIPYDSAIFVLTGPQSAHSNGVHHVAIALLKKRIRLYLMWHDNTEFSENETHETLGGILGEIAIRSGGDVLEIIDTDDDESISQSKNGTISKSNTTAFTTELLMDSDLKNVHKIAKHAKRETTTLIRNGSQSLAFVESIAGDFNTSALKANPTSDVKATSNIVRFPYDNTNDTNEEYYNDKAETLTDKQVGDDILQKSSTKIEMGVTSQILIKPGEFSNLYFEVTNTGLETIAYDVRVTDSRRYLFRLTSRRIILSGGQMRVVTVTISAPNRVNEGTTDDITFSVRGGNIITSLKVRVTVSTTLGTQDTTAPTVSWSFANRCNSLASSTTCADRWWSMKITAQDWESGIMRIVAHPSKGLIYTDEYTVGSSEPVKATYISNCCESKVSLTTYDIARNQQTYDIDVTVPDDASIAAISLGAILLVVLIILIVLCIVWYKRKNTELVFLPTYSSYSPRRRT